jgi:hypothetical protein
LALKELSRDSGRCTVKWAGPRVPPERLLKASPLMALYPVRSERMFCGLLDYNVLFAGSWI